MTREAILVMLRETFMEMFEVEPDAVTLDADLRDDLELDSIDAIDMAVKLQEMTGRKVDLAALKGLRTIADVVALVDAHVNSAS